MVQIRGVVRAEGLGGPGDSFRVAPERVEHVERCFVRASFEACFARTRRCVSRPRKEFRAAAHMIGTAARRATKTTGKRR
jgi:hypothetical protein